MGPLRNANATRLLASTASFESKVIPRFAIGSSQTGNHTPDSERQRFKRARVIPSLLRILIKASTYRPATDLGDLLHKNPRTCIGFICPSVRRMCFTQETVERGRAALLLDVDPVDLVRGKKDKTTVGLGINL